MRSLILLLKKLTLGYSNLLEESVSIAEAIPEAKGY
jgi:hypothetical protein